MRQRKQPIHMSSFGGATGFTFERGGNVEIAMNRTEISRILSALLEFEEGSRRPDAKLISAVKTVMSKAHSRFARTRIVAEVPIARKRAKLVPIW